MRIFLLVLAMAFFQFVEAQNWQKLDLGNGLFIKLPSKPKVQQIDQSRTSYGSLYGNCTFSVLASKISKERLPNSIEDEQMILAIVLGVEKAKQNNSLISASTFELSNVSGMEVTKKSSNPENGESGVVVTRAFFSDDVLYQATYLQLKSNNVSCEEHRKIFFNSITKQ